MTRPPPPTESAFKPNGGAGGIDKDVGIVSGQSAGHRQPAGPLAAAVPNRLPTRGWTGPAWTGPAGQGSDLRRAGLRPPRYPGPGHHQVTRP